MSDMNRVIELRRRADAAIGGEVGMGSGVGMKEKEMKRRSFGFFPHLFRLRKCRYNKRVTHHLACVAAMASDPNADVKGCSGADAVVPEGKSREKNIMIIG